MITTENEPEGEAKSNSIDEARKRSNIAFEERKKSLYKQWRRDEQSVEDREIESIYMQRVQIGIK